MSSISFHTHIFELEHLSGMNCLEIPKNIVEELGSKYNIRLICTVNNKLSFQCGLVALGEGRAYISITKKRMKELGLAVGSSVSLSLVPDPSKYGMQMPEELKELLNQNDEYKLRFDNLTAGKKRYIIQYVNSVKSSHLRIERALLLLNNLIQLPIGKESFREMLGLPREREI